jgi:hypothetical protein
MIISDWQEVKRNTLRGFFTVTLPSGLKIRDCSLHEKNGARWIAFPVKKNDDKFAPLIEFTSRGVAENFRRQVIDALKALGHA